VGKRYALIFFLLLLQRSGAAEPNRTFAEHLRVKKEYQWAALEYERLLCAYPDSAAAPVWRYRGAQCLMRLGRFDQALEQFTFANGPDIPSDSVRLGGALCALRLRRPDDAEKLLSSCTLDYSRLVRAYLDFGAQRYAQALDSLKTIGATSADAFKARALEKAVADARAFRKKHYAPALLLSLVPGLGHVYAGRNGDAAMSAIVIATGGCISAYYAYHGSKERMYAVGTITGLFYAGNIYGATVAVKIRNRDTIRHLHETAERIVFGE
jgi:tetratricopeptide (TPR) repeat protein